MTTQADADEFCETLLRHFAADLSPWEDKFVRSLQDQRLRGRELSESQLCKLDEVMESCARRL